MDGQLVFNIIALRLNAALCGIGLAYIPEDIVSEHIAAGRLITVLQDWCPFIAGYHLYYPNRQPTSPAFTLLLNALRYKQ